MLKAVENYRLRSVQMKDREGRLDKTLNKHMPLRSAGSRRYRQAEDDTFKDMLSHFFLRTAFCPANGRATAVVPDAGETLFRGGVM